MPNLSNPSFSTLRAEQDSVLVCTKKDGVTEKFEYLKIEDVKYKGRPIKEIFDEKDKQIAMFEKRIKNWELKLNNFIRAFKGVKK